MASREVDETPPSKVPSRFTAGDVYAERYRIVSLLGAGGMGEVYRAYDFVLDLDVALKFLPESLEKDTTALQQLKEEVKTAREIAHPNVCRVFDIGEASGVFFLSMEYITGDTLSSYLKRLGRISREKAYSISRQLCASLNAVHDKKILHRDLKPSNILLDEAGNVVLTDFGLAATIGEKTVGGTPAYMAPELWEGRESSKASDIYALGLVLFEVFTGRKVFRGKTPPQLAFSHLQEEPPPPSRFLPSIDDDVEKVILACLAKAPEDRPASAMSLAERFDVICSRPAPVIEDAIDPRHRELKQEGTEPREGTTHPKLQGAAKDRNGSIALAKVFSKRRFLLLLGALALLGLAIGLATLNSTPEYETVRELANVGVLAVPSGNGYRVFLDESIDSEQLPAVWALLRKLRHVEELAISDVKGFTALEPVRQLEGLQKLSLAEMAEVSRLDALEGMTTIRELSLKGLPGVDKLDPVGSLENLRTLRLIDLERVDDLTALKSLKTLEELTLSDMGEISREKVEALRLLIPQLTIKDLRHQIPLGIKDLTQSALETKDLPSQTPTAAHKEERGQIRAFSPPRITSSITLPDYPETAKAEDVSGDVKLRVTIDKEGSVEKIIVVQPLPSGLTKATVRAVTDWRFEPAQLNGEPIAVDYELKVSFVGRESGGFVVLYGFGRVVRIRTGTGMSGIEAE